VAQHDEACVAALSLSSLVEDDVTLHVQKAQVMASTPSAPTLVRLVEDDMTLYVPKPKATAAPTPSPAAPSLASLLHDDHTIYVKSAAAAVTPMALTPAAGSTPQAPSLADLVDDDHTMHVKSNVAVESNSFSFASFPSLAALRNKFQPMAQAASLRSLVDEDHTLATNKLVPQPSLLRSLLDEDLTMAPLAQRTVATTPSTSLHFTSFRTGGNQPQSLQKLLADDMTLHAPGTTSESISSASAPSDLASLLAADFTLVHMLCTVACFNGVCAQNIAQNMFARRCCLNTFLS
jgi:hypothetical protein